jgi:NitT/TauT family transport system ATP-binding protein/nitrate/nitrite transport system substrate-binding protein
LGILRLVDSLPVVVAARGMSGSGSEIELTIEPSWANIADKLAFGLLDGAVVLGPLAVALACGLRQPAADIVIASGLTRGGNSLVLAPEFRHTLGSNAAACARAFLRQVRGLRSRPCLAAVHPYSSHAMLVRAFVELGGGDPGHDAEIVVLPPEQVVDALHNGDIAGSVQVPLGAS